MYKKLSAPLLVFVLALSFAARADQDDIDNNADLQPTPEEKAKLAVLRRWPDATDIDALDMSDDAEDANPNNDAMDKPDADADVGKGAAEVAMDDEDKDADDAANWSVSVLFVSGGKRFEALLDDDAKIQYVYETVDVNNIPKDISTAAKVAAKGDEVVFCQKVSDESQLPIMHLWLVTVGEKNVLMDTEGKVLNVHDVPAEPDEDAAPPAPAEEEDNNKLRI